MLCVDYVSILKKEAYPNAFGHGTLFLELASIIHRLPIWGTTDVQESTSLATEAVYDCKATYSRLCGTLSVTLAVTEPTLSIRVLQTVDLRPACPPTPPPSPARRTILLPQPHCKCLKGNYLVGVSFFFNVLKGLLI